MILRAWLNILSERVLIYELYIWDAAEMNEDNYIKLVKVVNTPSRCLAKNGLY